ncbi:MAG: preprotein translocase subunit YajC [Aeromicrobium sp.]
MNDVASILPFVLLAVIFVVLVIRPARARRREFESLQGQLEIGQRVMLASGIYGELVTVDDDTIGLRIAPETVVTVNRHAVSRVIPPEPDIEASTDL